MQIAHLIRQQWTAREIDKALNCQPPRVYDVHLRIMTIPRLPRRTKIAHYSKKAPLKRRNRTAEEKWSDPAAVRAKRHWDRARRAARRLLAQSQP